jgi:hypothetical protein
MLKENFQHNFRKFRSRTADMRSPTTDMCLRAADMRSRTADMRSPTADMCVRTADMSLPTAE